MKAAKSLLTTRRTQHSYPTIWGRTPRLRRRILRTRCSKLTSPWRRLCTLHCCPKVLPPTASRKPISVSGLIDTQQDEKSRRTFCSTRKTSTITRISLQATHRRGKHSLAWKASRGTGNRRYSRSFATLTNMGISRPPSFPGTRGGLLCGSLGNRPTSSSGRIRP